MSRPLTLLLVVLVILFAGLFLLAGRARERPVTRIEKAVSLANLAG